MIAGLISIGNNSGWVEATTYRSEYEAEWHAMRPSWILCEMIAHDDSLALLHVRFLLRDLFRIQVFQHLTSHILDKLIAVEDLLRSSSSWDLKQSDAPCAAFFCKFDVSVQIVNDVVQARRLRHEESMDAFFLVVQSYPGDLDCLLRLKLRKSDFERLIEENIRGLLDVAWLYHLGKSVTVVPANWVLADTIVAIRGREANLIPWVLEVISDLSRDLWKIFPISR